MRILVETLVLVLLAVLGAGQPVNNLPTLKDAPAEVLYRPEQTRPFIVECIPASGDVKQFKYKWTKNGEPFDLASHPDVVQRHNEGTLVFLRPSEYDDGFYQCLAETPYGTASTRVIVVRKTYLDVRYYDLKEITPVEGRPFKLDCPYPAYAYPKPDIEWRKVQVVDPQLSSEISDAGITVGPDGALYFASATKEEVSERFKYVCLAKSPAVDEPVVLGEFLITGLETDKQSKDHEVVKQYASKDTTARVGERINLYCIYGGDPLAHPDWFKDGKDINNSPGDRVTRYNRSVGKKLLIREVLPEDQGNYSCLIDNEVGKKQEHSFKLTVVEAANFTKIPEKVLRVKAGDDVTIPCQVEGIPAPKLIYTYSAAALKNSRITAENGFSIKKIEKSDSGYYGCNATNEYGGQYYETLVLVA